MNRNNFHNSYIYRPQTKFAKVMFSPVFICPQWGGLCPGEGSLSKGGSLSRGVSVQRGGSVQGRGSLSLPGGVSVRGGGSVRRGVCIREIPPYGNELAVRILLECILVWKVNL